MRRFRILLTLGSTVAVGGAALAIFSSSWTLYAIGFVVLCVGVVLIVAACHAADGGS